jgi:putative phosphoserine phosphatase/1-acylglycerol-3-phosphate O-acyltransferase
MEHILNDPKFLNTLTDLVEETGNDYHKIFNEATKYLEEIYTTINPVYDTIASEAAQYILSRGYDKTIDINVSELKSLSKLMRKQSVAFVMTHKTYIDMMVLRVVLARHGLPQPYIFSGINMSFTGLAQLGKNMGLIFIRRSFKDNPVYKATLKHFISSCVKEKAHFMWAIEGTRSRTGKLVWPKMGILKYIMEAEEGIKEKVSYVPVSIVYDLIPDVEDMTQEGRGKEKKPESLSWGLNYIKNLGEKLGKISLRVGQPVPINDTRVNISEEQLRLTGQGNISRFALDIANKINNITPVTTVSLICISLLSKYSQSKQDLEWDVADLMQLIEYHKPDALVDRGKPIGSSVQHALNLLINVGIVSRFGDSLHAKYVINEKNYMQATYYANMAVHHFYHRAFIGLALHMVAEIPAEDRTLKFWTYMMEIRDIFKFEFFYSSKANFCDEIEADLNLLNPGWKDALSNPEANVIEQLKKQTLLVAPVILYNYIEAYRVVALALKKWPGHKTFSEDSFLDSCLFLGGELHWQGIIQHIETVSKPFLMNGIRLIQNKGLTPSLADDKAQEIDDFISVLDRISVSIKSLRHIPLESKSGKTCMVPIDRAIVPGSKTDDITSEIMKGESGSHIGAFFDLDRTLIKGFSAKEFFQARLFSGKMSSREVVAQFSGVLVYAVGNRNFAGLAAIGAKGVRGIKESVFIEVGEEVYMNHLADTIYPESRALVDAHLAKGHTVAIVSAATPYQVNPIARDLKIEHVMCTKMEVVKGTFTGKLIEPTCWGEGKAHAARELAKEHNLDLSKSYFYTDSYEDMPLLEIVGRPRPSNPDKALAAVAFQRDWMVFNFQEEKNSNIENIVRTFLTLGSLIPAAMKGLTTGTMSMSIHEGVNSMIASVGDLGTSLAGISLAIKGEDNLWNSRPAVFLFNHQSSADFFIVAKLLRKDVRAIAKKELQSVPILGQMMSVGGVIFIDRKNREQAIEAMTPAVDALKSGTSIAIAPEGTRSYDYSLGPFKKGAFHLALQARVPIVPIVLKNAHDAMPRGTNIFKPTMVEVIVLDPVHTTDWEAEKLNDYIRDIRQLYLKHLGQTDRSLLLETSNGQ